MYRLWFQLLALVVFLVSGGSQVAGMEVYTSKEVEGVNGTDVRLKCTFKSNHPVSVSSVIVSWNFKPLDQGAEESVFFYQETPYPPTGGRFKGHAVWSGDIMRHDASITLQDAIFSFNGTFTCQVRNLPDVHGINGEVVLRIVSRSTVSEIKILAIAVGSAIGLSLLILTIFVAVKYYRSKRDNTVFDHHLDGTEWREHDEGEPVETTHLKFVKTGKEEISSDGVEPAVSC